MVSTLFLVKNRKHLLVFLGVILVAGAGFYLWQIYGWKIGIDSSCIEVEKHNIRGRSMAPLLQEGEEVKGLWGYYDCNEIKKGEVVILEFKTRQETFIKKIIGLPGDTLEFQNNQLKLNDEILKNSGGEPYMFSEISQRIITIPLKDGKIQEGRYLILSEEKDPAAFDSRQFGFVEKEHLKGRVIY